MISKNFFKIVTAVYNFINILTPKPDSVSKTPVQYFAGRALLTAQEYLEIIETAKAREELFDGFPDFLKNGNFNPELSDLLAIFETFPEKKILFVFVFVDTGWETLTLTMGDVQKNDIKELGTAHAKEKNITFSFLANQNSVEDMISVTIGHHAGNPLAIDVTILNNLQAAGTGN